jgi:hypothetical protein
MESTDDVNVFPEGRLSTYAAPSGGCSLKTGNLPVKKTGKWNFTGIIYRFLP